MHWTNIKKILTETLFWVWCVCKETLFWVWCVCKETLFWVWCVCKETLFLVWCVCKETLFLVWCVCKEFLPDEILWLCDVLRDVLRDVLLMELDPSRGVGVNKPDHDMPDVGENPSAPDGGDNTSENPPAPDRESPPHPNIETPGTEQQREVVPPEIENPQQSRPHHPEAAPGNDEMELSPNIETSRPEQPREVVPPEIENPQQSRPDHSEPAQRNDDREPLERSGKKRKLSQFESREATNWRR